MKKYAIVTNDEYELPIATDFSSAAEVGKYLGISKAAVLNRIRRGQKRTKYKVICKEIQLTKRKSNAEYCKKYDMTHDRSEYFRKYYRKRKQERIMAELFTKYPIDTTIHHDGMDYQILGYEIYSDTRYLICTDGYNQCRLNAERISQ